LPPALGDFGEFSKHVSAEILPKYLPLLLCVSVLKCSILAYILFKYQQLDPSARGRQRWSRRGEKFSAGAVAPLLPAPMVARMLL